MDEAGKTWVNGLKQFEANCRKRSPLPSRDDLSPLEAQQCRILGGSWLAWLKHHAPGMLEERAVLHKAMHVDPEPVVVFLSIAPGLIAAHKIFGDRAPDGIVCLKEDQFKRWPRKSPDRSMSWHAYCMQTFRKVTDHELGEHYRAQSIPEDCEAWLHIDETL